MAGFGALVRFILRLTGRVKIDKKKDSFQHTARKRSY
jgi:hypothetical protein